MITANGRDSMTTTDQARKQFAAPHRHFRRRSRLLRLGVAEGDPEILSTGTNDGDRNDVRERFHALTQIRIGFDHDLSVARIVGRDNRGRHAIGGRRHGRLARNNRPRRRVARVQLGGPTGGRDWRQSGRDSLLIGDGDLHGHTFTFGQPEPNPEPRETSRAARADGQGQVDHDVAHPTIEPSRPAPATLQRQRNTN